MVSCGMRKRPSTWCTIQEGRVLALIIGCIGNSEYWASNLYDWHSWHFLKPWKKRQLYTFESSSNVGGIHFVFTCLSLSHFKCAPEKNVYYQSQVMITRMPLFNSFAPCELYARMVNISRIILWIETAAKGPLVVSFLSNFITIPKREKTFLWLKKVRNVILHQTQNQS